MNPQKKNPQKNDVLPRLFSLSQRIPAWLACIAILLTVQSRHFVANAHASATAPESHPAITGTSHNILVGGKIETVAGYSPISSSAGAVAGDWQAAMIGRSSLDSRASAAGGNLKTALVTIAGQGGGPGTLDGTGDAARFDNVMGLVADKAGNLFAADASRHTIRKITPDGTVTTFAGRADEAGDVDGAAVDARLSNPSSMAIDPVSNNIYFISNNKIKKLATDGTVTTFFSGLPAHSDRHILPANRLASDGLGNIYVHGLNDFDNKIYKILPNGQSALFAGNGETGLTFADSIMGITASADGSVYVYEGNKLHKITQSKEVSSIAVDDPVFSPSSNFREVGMTVDASSNIYIVHSNPATISLGVPSETPARCVIIKITSDGRQSIVYDTQNDTLRDASLNRLGCATLAVNATGDIYVSDVLNNRICKMNDAGTLVSFVGQAARVGLTDATGTSARFDSPDSVTITPNGNIFVADTRNQVIRKIASNGEVSRFAGDPRNTATNFANGNLDGDGDSAGFYRPKGITSSPNGDLYIQSNQSVAKITPERSVSEVAGIMSGPDTLLTTSAGDILYYTVGFVDDRSGHTTGWTHTRTDSAILKVNTQSSGIGYSQIVTFEVQTRGDALDQYIKGIAIDANDGLYFSFGNSVCKMTGSSSFAPIAGVAGISGTNDGIGTDARFDNPTGVAMDASGCIYVIDGGGTVIRRINPETRAVTTIAGKYRHSGGRDGLDGNGYIAGPSKLFVDKDGDGSIYFADTPDNTIRMLQISPEILQHPQGQEARTGANVILKALATSAPHPAYQWYKNNNPIASATTNTLALDGVQLTDSGTYTVKVSNLMDAVTSNAAILTVANDPPGPAGPSDSTGGGNNNTGGDDGGGGGGASSCWYLAALVVFTLARLHRGK
jgi:sugar lactone lactonase YvrE